MPGLDDLLRRSLDSLSAQGLLRRPAEAPLGADVLVACSNDYLGLAGRSVSRETASGGPSGSGASRLVHGTHQQHLDLEAALAAWVGKPQALLFSSGYAANVGVLSSMGDGESLIVSDELNHASIIDGCRLSRARTAIARHLDLEHTARLLQDGAAASARWVVTESYYSMDGDSPDLAGLRELCDRHDAFLVVDEAHALGLFGPNGSGLCGAAKVEPDIIVGTLGKALGASGAFAAGSGTLREWLWNRARSFVFSTAPPPFLASLVSTNLRQVQDAEAARATLHEHANRLRTELRAQGATIPTANHGPIIPVLVGSATRAVALSEAIRARGIAVQAIRPPTVPPGSSRLRLTVNAAMTASELSRLAQAVAEALQLPE